MQIDQTNYVQKVDSIEIDRVQSRFGGELLRVRFKGADEDSSVLSFTLWGVFDPATLDHKPIRLVINDVNERGEPEPATELENEEPDV